MDRHSTGDGIVAALQVLAALREQQVSLSGLLSELVLYPQKMINVPIGKGFAWEDAEPIKAAKVQVEERLKGRGRVLIRASGTEPLLRVMVEGDDLADVMREVDYLAGVVRSTAAESAA